PAATAGPRVRQLQRREGERMKTLISIARYHLVDRMTYLVLPWGAMMFSFLVNLVIATEVAPVPNGYYTGGVVTLYCFLFVCGVLSMTRSLSFGLMLGVSRRAYYLGTALLVLVLRRGVRPRADRAAGHRAGHRRVGPGRQLLPGAVDPGRPVVRDLADSVRAARAVLPVRHVVRARVPALEPARAGRVPRRPGTGRAGSCRRGD